MHASAHYMSRWWKKPAINKIVMTLIYSDFLFLTAGGVITPIYAVFITGQIKGGSLIVVGLATTVFWVVKSLVQIPVSWYVDRKRGERDDYMFMVVGTVISALVPLLYYFFAHEVWHVYALETLNGFGFALQVPTWLAIFTRHIDHHRESTEWTIHSNGVGLGFAGAAALGGYLGDKYGIRPLFPVVSAVMIVGAIVLLLVREDIIASDLKNGHAPK